MTKHIASKLVYIICTMWRAPLSIHQHQRDFHSFIFFSLFHWISVNNLNDMRDIYTDISYYIHLIPIDVSTQSWLASIQREDLVEDRDNSHTYYQRTLL